MRTQSLVHLGIIAVCLFAGCSSSDDGPERYRISGKVTFNGEPVPAGMITFDPDYEAGNSGPQGFARIENGKFDTAIAPNRGPVAGAAVITITGLKSANANPEAEAGVLFKDYVIRENFNERDVEMNFDIPANAKK